MSSLNCPDLVSAQLSCRGNKIHGNVEVSKEFDIPGAKYMCIVLCTWLFCPQSLQRQPNRYSLEPLFTFPNLLVFLTYAIMWRTGSFLLAPLVRSNPLAPSHWQALDLESGAVIVIYASTDDRCAHIVSTLRAKTAQGHGAVRIQSLPLPQKVKLSPHVPIDSIRS